MGLLNLLDACDLACTNRPNWFIRDDGFNEGVNAAVAENRAELSVKDGFGLPRFPFFECFADAQNGTQFGGTRACKFSGDASIIFAIKSAPFGVTNQYEATTQIGEHRRMNLAGKSTGLVLITKVLRTQHYRGL